MKKLWLVVGLLLMAQPSMADDIKSVKGVIDLNVVQKRLDTQRNEIAKLREELKSTKYTLEQAIAQLKKETDWKLGEINRKLSGADGKGGIQKEITKLHSKTNKK